MANKDSGTLVLDRYPSVGFVLRTAIEAITKPNDPPENFEMSYRVSSFQAHSARLENAKRCFDKLDKDFQRALRYRRLRPEEVVVVPYARHSKIPRVFDLELHLCWTDPRIPRIRAAIPRRYGGTYAVVRGQLLTSRTVQTVNGETWTLAHNENQRWPMAWRRVNDLDGRRDASKQRLVQRGRPRDRVELARLEGIEEYLSFFPGLPNVLLQHRDTCCASVLWIGADIAAASGRAVEGRPLPKMFAQMTGPLPEVPAFSPKALFERWGLWVTVRNTGLYGGAAQAAPIQLKLNGRMTVAASIEPTKYPGFVCSAL